MSKLKQLLFSLNETDRKIIEEKLKEKDQQIDQLKQQLVEKDKEIGRLENLFELNNEVVINQGNEIFDLRVQVLQQKQNQTQLAIQELEKVKTLIQNAINFEKPNFVEVYDAINKQIKELKGEKNDNY